MLSKSRVMSGDTQPEWEITWGDTPVAIRFKTLKGAVVALELPYSEHDSTTWAEVSRIFEVLPAV